MTKRVGPFEGTVSAPADSATQQTLRARVMLQLLADASHCTGHAISTQSELSDALFRLHEALRQTQEAVRLVLNRDARNTSQVSGGETQAAVDEFGPLSPVGERTLRAVLDAQVLTADLRRYLLEQCAEGPKRLMRALDELLYDLAKLFRGVRDSRDAIEDRPQRRYDEDSALMDLISEVKRTKRAIPIRFGVLYRPRATVGCGTLFGDFILVGSVLKREAVCRLFDAMGADLSQPPTMRGKLELAPDGSSDDIACWVSLAGMFCLAIGPDELGQVRSIDGWWLPNVQTWDDMIPALHQLIGLSPDQPFTRGADEGPHPLETLLAGEVFRRLQAHYRLRATFPTPKAIEEMLLYI